MKYYKSIVMVVEILYTYLRTFLYSCMSKKIITSTERGQITLPKEWREKFGTNSYLMHMDDKKIVVVPLNLEDMASEEVLFDADRDNDGKGISPEEIIKILKKIRHG